MRVTHEGVDIVINPKKYRPGEKPDKGKIVIARLAGEKIEYHIIGNDIRKITPVPIDKEEVVLHYLNKYFVPSRK